MDRSTIKKSICILLSVALLINLVLSVVIEMEKTHTVSQINNGTSPSATPCFIEGSQCALVQTSTYSSTFSVSNPVWGIIFFSLMLVLLFALYHLEDLHKPAKKQQTMVALTVLMLAGSLFSAWLLYIQYFVIEAVCSFCVWVDGIMIGATLLYIGTYRDEIKKLWKKIRG